MVRSAVAELERRARPSTKVLEVGAGYSTLWWARRAGEVVGLEASADWADRLRAELQAKAVHNARIESVSLADTLATLASYSDSNFDVVVVDCGEAPGLTRLDVVIAAERLVSAGGVLVLDDSDRRHLWAADEHLARWHVHRYIGVKPAPLMAVETTIYEKPL